uniref:Uncharacterized protein n=1 Tax=Cannabis sativa TaxID=3483 RepID=A0A803R8Y4_CANSA
MNSDDATSPPAGTSSNQDSSSSNRRACFAKPWAAKFSERATWDKTAPGNLDNKAITSSNNVPSSLKYFFPLLMAVTKANESE